ncbi:hypothetical protein ACFOSX_11820 [Winogradskyella maritima]|uniref:Uncharacterized protein n=1 Tax=Winogradskyella maritima TaxID=1517766 RepID=A0ABV8AKJ5_9FLAO
MKAKDLKIIGICLCVLGVSQIHEINGLVMEIFQNKFNLFCSNLEAKQNPFGF